MATAPRHRGRHCAKQNNVHVESLVRDACPTRTGGAHGAWSLDPVLDGERMDVHPIFGVSTMP